MAIIDWAKSTFPAGNNISRPELVSSQTNRDAEHFLAGASDFQERTQILKPYFQGFMSRATANTPDSDGFAFDEPQTITLHKYGTENILQLVMRFGVATGQFPTRLTIDGAEHKPTSPTFKVTGLRNIDPHVIEITHWNTQNLPIRITSIYESDNPQYGQILLGTSRADLQPFDGRMFSNWMTRNRLVDVADPTETLDQTIHRDNDLGYRPEASFDFNYHSPAEKARFVQIVNTPRFVCGYFDQELCQLVIREMKCLELGSDRPIAFNSIYRGMVGNRYNFVSYHTYDARDANGVVHEQPYYKLIEWATTDPRIK